MLFSKRPSNTKAEQELVQRFLAREKQAEHALFQLVHRLLDKGMQALQKKGSYFRDPENIRDEITAALLVNKDAAVLRNFQGQSRLSTYLWSIIRFKLIDKLRAERIRPVEQALPARSNFSTSPHLPDELYALIETFIAKNAGTEAFILRCKWLENLDYKKICEKGKQNGITITQSQIGNLLFKKRMELAGFLEKHGYPIDKPIADKYSNK